MLDMEMTAKHIKYGILRLIKSIIAEMLYLMKPKLDSKMLMGRINAFLMPLKILMNYPSMMIKNMTLNI
jgi:hypothetical protein